jgi:Spherulation-specific family 4
MRHKGNRLGPVVPAYFHPAIAPREWRILAAAAASTCLVVVNAASGPGDRPDPGYVEVIDRLRDAGAPIAGYVDTDYGRRPLADALAEIARYQEWYPVSSVFFDRVSSGIEHLPYYRTLAADSRRAGMELVAFNHGTHPVRDYAEHADLLGTFEGPFSTFVELDVPSWVHDFPADRFFQLVYDSPPTLAATIARLAVERNVGSIYRTEGTGANPWSILPADFPDAYLFTT